MVAKARDFNRLDRVNASVKRVLAPALSELVRAHTGMLATVTAVKLSPDLRQAVVHLSLYGAAVDKQALLRALAGNSPELQAEVADKLRLKRTPVLEFRLDEAIERADRITQLLHPAGRERTGC